jgi:hypothetical protein
LVASKVRNCNNIRNLTSKLKVYYHLEQFKEAMQFALAAGKLFEVSKQSEFIDTLVCKSQITLLFLISTKPNV